MGGTLKWEFRVLGLSPCLASLRSESWVSKLLKLFTLSFLSSIVWIAKRKRLDYVIFAFL